MKFVFLAIVLFAQTILAAQPPKVLIVLNQGYRPEEYFEPQILLESIKKEKITGLICAATGLLATADNLDGTHPQFKGKHGTGYGEIIVSALKKQ